MSLQAGSPPSLTYFLVKSMDLEAITARIERLEQLAEGGAGQGRIPLDRRKAPPLIRRVGAVSQ